MLCPSSKLGGAQSYGDGCVAFARTAKTCIAKQIAPRSAPIIYGDRTLDFEQRAQSLPSTHIFFATAGSMKITAGKPDPPGLSLHELRDRKRNRSDGDHRADNPANDLRLHCADI